MPFAPANIFESAFGPLIKAFEEVLVFMHQNLVGGSWGWAIIGLTVAIRLVLFPLFVRQMKSIVTLQRHMPEMKAIQEKYKEDKQRQNEELMKFYRENHINPFASCLPLLLQMPVLISLYYMLRTDLKKKICGPQLTGRYNHLHHTAISSVAHLPTKYVEKTSCGHVAGHAAKFLFIPDLTTKATGGVLALLVALYVLTMMASSLLSSATADRNQRLMAIGLPLAFTLFVINFPTGLLVYWISSNIWTIGQGAAIRRRMPPIKQPTADSAPPAETPAARSRLKLRPFAGAAAGPDGEDGEDMGRANGAAAAAVTPPPPPRKRKRRRTGRRR